RHPDERQPRPAVRAHGPVADGPQAPRRLAPYEVADEDAVLHGPALARGHALVVVPERPEATRARRVDRDVHLIAPVAERAEAIGREERRAGERGLGPKRPVELDRVAAALVALEHQLVRAEDHRRPDVLRTRL